MSTSSNTILIVEDEPKLAELLADYLGAEGYLPEIISEGTHAVERIAEVQPALVLLDLNLPGKDGLSICREVRVTSMVPIIMVTARVEEIDRLIGLEVGADDYVCKPFSPREVVARVRTVLRRTQAPPLSDPADARTLTYRDLALDLDRMQCQRGGVDIELTPVEHRMLSVFLERPGFVQSRSTLMARCYEDHRIVSDRTIDSHVKNLRRKLSEHGDSLVHSIYGVGYKLE